jgi:hypothetical protein
MARSIEIDANALVRKLDVFAKVQMPFMTSVALNRTATKVRNSLQESMVDTFTYLAPYTYNSLFIRVSSKANLTTEIGVKQFGIKGNAAGDYLKPQVYGGKVFETRFQRRLQRTVGMKGYMLPLHGSDAAELNPSGRINAGQYTAALYGIKAMEDVRGSGSYGKFNYKTLGTYVYIRPGQIAFSGRGDRPLAPGIYRVKGTELSMLFKELRRPPNVPAKWNFFGIAESSARRELPNVFDAVFKETMGRANL